MKRVVGGVVTTTVLALGLTACTSDSEPEEPSTPTKQVAVDPEEVVRHEATAGTPISFGIEVPDGAVQVGPLIRQRRIEVNEVIEEPEGRADAFGNGDETDDDVVPEARNPKEPLPPDFTTALLRVDDDPSEVVKNTVSELADALPDRDIDPDKWADHCAVVNGMYTGCELEVSGKTEEDERISVELTVDPGDPKTKVAPAGSLLRPVITLTIEVQRPADDDGGNYGDDNRDDNEEKPKNAENTSNVRADDGSGDEPDNKGNNGDNGDTESENAPEPEWPSMKRERPAKPGDWILTPKWKVRPNTEVILSGTAPKVAMLAVKDGADADAIARRYVNRFADVATTPKIDEVEDRNERSLTFTPRNDGSGPSVAVTAVATGRGNYIELLFADDSGSGSEAQKQRKRNRAKSGPKPRSADKPRKDAAKQNRSN